MLWTLSVSWKVWLERWKDPAEDLPKLKGLKEILNTGLTNSSYPHFSVFAEEAVDLESEDDRVESEDGSKESEDESEESDDGAEESEEGGEDREYSSLKLEHDSEKNRDDNELSDDVVGYLAPLALGNRRKLQRDVKAKVKETFREIRRTNLEWI